jgi:hypothetical protein
MKGFTMNWKTTIFGLLAFLPQLINLIIPSIPDPWDKFCLGIGGILAFYFAKDKEKKSG